MSSNKVSDPRFPASALAWLGIIFFLLAAPIRAVATTVVPPEFPTLVNDSDYIIHAVTKNVAAEKRASPGGTKIVTLVELEVLEIVAGKPPAKIVLELLGGRVGDETMTVEGMPRFRVGDEDILFVSGNGRTFCPLYGMMHGRYSVAREPSTGRTYMTRVDGAPLQDTAQIAMPLAAPALAQVLAQRASATALAPAEFIRQIRASVRPDSHVNRAN